MTKAETVETLQKAMEIWNKFERIVRSLNPDDDDEQVYQKTKAAMNLAIENATAGRGTVQ